MSNENAARSLEQQEPTRIFGKQQKKSDDRERIIALDNDPASRARRVARIKKLVSKGKYKPNMLSVAAVLNEQLFAE